MCRLNSPALVGEGVQREGVQLVGGSVLFTHYSQAHLARTLGVWVQTSGVRCTQDQGYGNSTPLGVASSASPTPPASDHQ